MQEIGHDKSCALVEERDYIGLSEASSAIEMERKKSSGPILKEEDLRLGLGLGLALGSCSEEDDDADTKPAKEMFPDRPRSTERIGTKRGASEISRKPLWLQGSSSISGICSQDSTASEAPPCKDQIVGWPPVRLYRKQTLSKPAEMFVKVNMDGVAVGRKVDLSAYGCYKGLLLALEEMFRPAVRDSDNKHFLLSSEPDYVLTYEDKEGDWMLVGDVPWSMFTSTVGRLRIARGSEANGTGVGMPHPTSAKFCR